MSEHLSPRTTRFSQQGKLLIHTYLREIRPIDTQKRRSIRTSLVGACFRKACAMPTSRSRSGFDELLA